MTLDWEDVKAFVAVARAGSLTQAVRTSGFSQPTLGRKLKNLEDAIGGSLFERLPNKMLLTPLGERLVELGAAMDAAASNLKRTAQSVLQQQRPPIRISTTNAVALFLTEHLAILSAQASRHGQTIDIEPSRVPLSLAHHQADIAIRLRAFPDDGLMTVRRIGKIAATMYCAASGAAAAVVGLSDNRPPPQPGWVNAFAARNGLPVVARVGEFFLRHEAIRSGLGMSLLPCFVGDRDQRLRRACEPPAELDEDAFLLLHNQAAHSPAAQAVADCIAGIFQSQAALFSGQTVQPPA